MIPGLLRHFRTGDTERTAFSAAVMNEFVDALNMFLRARPGVGLKLYFADGGLRIELDDFLQKRLALTGDGKGGAGVDKGQGPGPLRWRGLWNVDSTYERNDLVYDLPASTVKWDGRFGVFLATQDVPKGKSAPGININNLESPVYWDYFSPGPQTTISAPLALRELYVRVDDTFWVQIVSTTGSIIARGSSSKAAVDPTRYRILSLADATLAEFSDSRVSGANYELSGTSLRVGPAAGDRIELGTANIPAGKTVQLRQITYKNSAGDNETRLFSCSETL